MRSVAALDVYRWLDCILLIYAIAALTSNVSANTRPHFGRAPTSHACLRPPTSNTYLTLRTPARLPTSNRRVPSDAPPPTSGARAPAFVLRSSARPFAGATSGSLSAFTLSLAPRPNHFPTSNACRPAFRTHPRFGDHPYLESAPSSRVPTLRTPHTSNARPAALRACPHLACPRLLRMRTPTLNPRPRAQFQWPLAHFQRTRALFGRRPAPYFERAHAHAPFEPLPAPFEPLPANFDHPLRTCLALRAPAYLPTSNALPRPSNT
ncbi:hypothetical protein K438DRAFT_2021677 [Mycena galopus ATCC 62051]|nr:hypothetical protein K438DRAFT_2021677 [Mycena galopus ATCC 62051]